MINRTEYYNETGIESIVFSYGFKNEAISNKKDFPKNVNFQNYENKNIVISYNPLDYGVLTSQNKIENGIFYTLINKNKDIINFKEFKDHNLIEIIGKNNEIIYSIKDVFVSENKFMRIINNKTFFFENNKQILFTKEMKSKFITKLKFSKNLTENFLTLDIETFVKDSVLTVFCIGIYDGIKTQTFYLSDYENPEQLILAAIKSIMIRKYNK
jgi:hypothetical protein